MIFTDLMFSTVVTPFLADAAANAAPDGAWISKGAIAALCTGLGAVAGKLWPTRVKAEVKRPVDSDDTFVTAGQCRQHRCGIQKQIDQQLDFQRTLLRRLDEMDQKAEKRSVDLHRRLDPIVKETAANKAQIEVIKELAVKSSIGGKK